MVCPLFPLLVLRGRGLLFEPLSRFCCLVSCLTSCLTASCSCRLSASFPTLPVDVITLCLSINSAISSLVSSSTGRPCNGTGVGVLLMIISDCSAPGLMSEKLQNHTPRHTACSIFEVEGCKGIFIEVCNTTERRNRRKFARYKALAISDHFTLSSFVPTEMPHPRVDPSMPSPEQRQHTSSRRILSRGSQGIDIAKTRCGVLQDYHTSP